MTDRLVDAFQAEAARRGVQVPGRLTVIGSFGDLFGPPCGDFAYVASRDTDDPAFKIGGHTRYIALARILDEIRFFAARIEPLTPPWWWSNPARAAAVSAESEEYELAIFETVADAVVFSVRYLAGMALRDIDIVRTKPTAARYATTEWGDR
jgi:hypothetical protein